MSRVAVVTGGASGLGEAICRHLADAGNQVAVFDLTTGVDAGDRAAVDDAVARVRADLGQSKSS
jgi:2-hydroxycyclohexanecarboxyl-CoA dehydrogenase